MKLSTGIFAASLISIVYGLSGEFLSSQISTNYMLVLTVPALGQSHTKKSDQVLTCDPEKKTCRTSCVPQDDGSGVPFGANPEDGNWCWLVNDDKPITCETDEDCGKTMFGCAPPGEDIDGLGGGCGPS